MNILELLVAILKAYIFTLLSALFTGFAPEEHSHDEHSQDSTQAQQLGHN